MTSARKSLSRIPMSLTECEISAEVKKLIHRHGADAGTTAAMRADELEFTGDLAAAKPGVRSCAELTSCLRGRGALTKKLPI